MLACQWQQLGLQFDGENADDVAALALATQITRGNFRLIQRLFSQVDPILRVNQLRQVSPRRWKRAARGW